jgi:pantoate kinase
MNDSLLVGFSPASVTCFFMPTLGESAANSYSRGCAINIKQGVTAHIQGAPSHEIFFNGERKSIAPVSYIIEKIAPEPVKVSLESSLPLGFGFGLSSASCLATALTITRRYNLNLSITDLGNIAHEAEFTYKTGLGDVASQLCGGIVFRKCEHGPLDSERLAIESQPIYIRIFDELETAKVLTDKSVVERIAQAGATATKWLRNHIDNITLSDLLSTSYTFAKDTGLLTNGAVKACINDVMAQGGRATMIMLGHGVLSTLPVGETSQWIKCEIDSQGTRYRG